MMSDDRLPINYRVLGQLFAIREFVIALMCFVAAPVFLYEAVRRKVDWGLPAAVDSLRDALAYNGLTLDPAERLRG